MTDQTPNPPAGDPLNLTAILADDDFGDELTPEQAAEHLGVDDPMALLKSDGATPWHGPGVVPVTEAWAPPATTSEALTYPGSLMIAVIGVPQDPAGVRVVRVIQVEDQAVIYVGNDLVRSEAMAELDRQLHRAVKIYNAEVAAL
jgi:hypothetical protein